MKLGEKIISLRESKNMTRYRLAKNSGVAYSYLLDIESGKYNNCSIKILQKIAAALDTPISYFLDSKEG